MFEKVKEAAESAISIRATKADEITPPDPNVNVSKKPETITGKKTAQSTVTNPPAQPVSTLKQPVKPAAKSALNNRPKLTPQQIQLLREKQELLKKVRESVGKDLALEKTAAQLKETADGIGVNVQTKLKQSKEAINEFSLSNKVKDFTLASVRLAQEVDSELHKNNYQYEVNDFRVSANAGVVAGMTLDLHFTKTPGAKKVSEQESKFISITNPGTGKSMKVLRSAVHGKDSIKLKDPDTGETLVADTITGKILEIQPAPKL